MSPRRSSRARTTQPAPSGPNYSNSSSSSITSGRASQSVAPEHKSTSRSQSLENVDATQACRTRRFQDTVRDEVTHPIDDDVENESEEEVTRCICGNQEYAGPPVTTSDSNKGNSKSNPDPATFAEDATGWFIQCDDCKVWQHGGCVGIMDEATSPDEYFCEQCRSDLHKVTTTANGYVPLQEWCIFFNTPWHRRKYSLFLPIQEPTSPLSSPVSTTKKSSKRSKINKAAQLNADNLSKGRRSTMNSRDAVYAEEQLRLAIEESKREGGPASNGTSTRKGKRSRSNSDE